MVDSALVICAILIGSATILGLWQRDHRFTILIIAYGVLLSLATTISFADSEPVYGWSSPYLMESDGEAYFEQAQLLAIHGLNSFQTVVQSNYIGYQMLLGSLFLLFGPGLEIALILNGIFVLITIACLYRSTLLLTGSDGASFLACLAFMLTTTHIYHSLLLLKEPALGLAFSLVLLATTKGISERSFGFRPGLYLLLALLLITTMRASLLLFVFVLIAFLSTLLLKRRIYILGMFVVLAGLVVPFAQTFTVYELDSAYFASTIVENQVIAARFEAGDLDLGGVAGRVMGTYLNLPFVAKVFLFPIPVVAQLLLPFDFWSSAFVYDHFASFFSRNLNPLWYMFVAVWTGFAIWNLPRAQPPLLRRFFLAGLFYYVVIAIIYSGLIPRYASPALVFVYPAVGFWWAKFYDDHETRLRAQRFFGHYYVAALAAGVVFVMFQALR